MKHDGPLFEVLLLITMMDLIGSWELKYSHRTALSPYMAHECGNMIHHNHIDISRYFNLTAFFVWEVIFWLWRPEFLG